MYRFRLLLLLCILASSAKAQCPYISGLLADASTTGSPGGEGKNEFIVFNTGTNSINVNSIKFEYSTAASFASIAFSVDGSASGIWTSPATSGLFSNTGGTITNITSGTIPADKNVVIISKDNAINYDFQTFGSDVYVLSYDISSSGVSSYSSAGNFANTAAAARYLRIKQGLSCTNTVSYIPDNMPGGDGGGARWNSAGTITYVNTGASGAVLPVDLLSFSGSFQNEKPLIKWTTSGTSSAHYFNIERSADGSTFDKIGTVIAEKENCICTKNYSFIDNETLAGITLYRVRIFDIDGSEAYTPTLKLVKPRAKSKPISIFPNPAFDIITIENLKHENSSFIISDALGKTLIDKNLDPDNQTVNIGSLKPGTYWIRITQNSTTEMQQFIKQ